ncbi:MAG TPA: hypothetical protein VFN50_02905 [Acidimicrobiales bacterium]|nr:hypothetical protein [Acidimicrobiales bacterium]
MEETAFACALAFAAVPGVMGVTRGRRGALAGLLMVSPMFAKRAVGNRAPAAGYRSGVIWRRLLFDHD